jgi:VWFA-related protein
MRPTRLVRVVAIGLAPALLAAAVPQVEEPRKSFPAAVEEVLVDVVVADRDHAPKGGLAREDFLLSEDGVPQTILSFEAVDVTPSQAVRDPFAPLPTVSANPVATGRASGRTFLVLFDDLRLTPAQGLSARRALLDFLRRSVDDEDRLLLVTTAGATWWGTTVGEGRDDLEALVGGLQGRFQPEVVGDSVSDAEAYRIEVQRDAETFYHVLRRLKRLVPREVAAPAAPVAGFLDGTECTDITDPDKGILCANAKLAYERASERLRQTLGLLERGLLALDGVRGRKTAILVSPGVYHDTEIAELGRVTDASRRANAPVYFLNATGVPDIPIEMTAQIGQPLHPGDMSLGFRDRLNDAAGAEAIASDTGGLVVRTTNDLTKGLRRIADEARRYYLIGYTPTNAARDGKYRKIQVRVARADSKDREGWEVRARRGYYAPKEGVAAKDPGAPVREALASPFDLSGIPLRLAAYASEETTPGRVRCLLVGEVDVRSLGFREEEGRSLASLDVAFTTVAREGGTTEHAQRVEMRLVPSTRERLLRDGYVLTHEVELPAGVHQARLVVRDVASGRVGSVRHRIDIPEPGSFRISTPLVSDSLEPVAKGEPPRLLPIARREFAAGNRVFLSLDVFGSEKGDVTGRPRVSMGYEVIRPDGEVLTRQEARSIEPTPGGALHRLVGFTLAEAQAGEYRIEGQVVDEQTGKTLLFTEPFSARRAEPAARGQASAGRPGP